MAKDLIINNGKLETLKPVGAPNVRQINYILNADAEVDTTGWATYAESNSVTFQDSGDTVTLNSHGLLTGTPVVFSSITSTTGISINTTYYVVNPLTNTFQVASSVGGSALPLTTNGSGTMVRPVPVTGSGGTAQTDLWIRSTTSPLRGSASFRLDKTGSLSRQGQGVAYDFTIDKADQAKVLSISFDYEVLSANGTYADGDVTVYVYDVTNSVLIQPAGYVLQNVSLGTENKHIATFQTASNSTSYRLILHVSSASTQNYTLAIDNVTVGPQTVQYGAPVTDWISFNPTGTFTTNTTYSGKYRRVGSNIEMQVRLDFSGAPNSGTTLSVNLPISADLSKMPTTVVGQGIIRDAGSASYPLNVFLSTNTSLTPVYVISNNNGFPAYHNSITNVNIFNIGSGDYIDFELTYAATGLESTVQMSSDTDTRVVAFRAGGCTTTSGNSGLSNLTLYDLRYPTIQSDTHGSGASTGYTIPSPGFYNISAYVIASGTYSPGAYGGINLYLQKNSVDIATQLVRNTAGDGNVGAYAHANSVYCNAGEVIKARMQLSGWSSVGILSDTHLMINRLSGPSAIAASESVVFEARFSGTNQTLTHLVTNINLPTLLKDSHGGWNGTNGYVIPVSGDYVIHGSFVITTGSQGQLHVFVNGNNSRQISSNTGQLLNGSCTITNLAAGDLITFRCQGSVTVENNTLVRCGIFRMKT